MSGCDTTLYVYGIGKTTSLKAPGSGKLLELSGTEYSDKESIVSEAVLFMSMCYGSKTEDFSAMGFTIWSAKMANTKLSSAPKLRSLPPTIEVFSEHVLRAHYQTMIWKAALFSAPLGPAVWMDQEGQVISSNIT